MDNFGSPYTKIDNVEGYDQSEIKGILRHNVCAFCHGSLVAGHHDQAFTFTLFCRDDTCSGDSYVSKRYLEAIDKRQLDQGDDFYANFKDIIDSFGKE